MAAKPWTSRTDPVSVARALSNLEAFRIGLSTCKTLLETATKSLEARRTTAAITTTTPARTLLDSWLRNRRISMQITPTAVEHKRCSVDVGSSTEQRRSNRWPSAAATNAKSNAASKAPADAANAITYAGWAKG